MNLQITTAGQLAAQDNITCILYGDPGSGKTPMVNTAPNPLYIAVERGTGSLRGSNVPAIEARTPAMITQVINWICDSAEAKQYDTYYIDSLSEVAKVYLDQFLQTNKHGMAAYGDMSRAVQGILKRLVAVKGKNIVLVCHQGMYDSDNGTQRRPAFPGKDLDKEVPHFIDLILHAGLHDVPSKGMIKSLQTAASPGVLARNRLGGLADYEACKFDYLFNKIRNQ